MTDYIDARPSPPTRRNPARGVRAEEAVFAARWGKPRPEMSAHELRAVMLEEFQAGLPEVERKARVRYAELRKTFGELLGDEETWVAGQMPTFHDPVENARMGLEASVAILDEQTARRAETIAWMTTTLDEEFPPGSDPDARNARMFELLEANVTPIDRLISYAREHIREWAESLDEPEPMTEQETAEMDGMFVDLGIVLDGDFQPPVPTLGERTDGQHLFYENAVNILAGDPGGGKTFVAACLAADMLLKRRSVLWLDLDHNTAPAIVARLRMLGVPKATLLDRRYLRFAEPDDREGVEKIIDHHRRSPTALVIVDSIGELLPMFGADSNNSDEYAKVNRAVMTRLARQGSSVLAIDHLAKGVESRKHGAGGTIRKLAALDGAYYLVETTRPFVKGNGGKARLVMHKDRHAGVRVAKGDDAATFELCERMGDDGRTAADWKFWAPFGAEPAVTVEAPAMEPVTDVGTVAGMIPPPTSARDVQRRTQWGTTRAAKAYKQWEEMRRGEF